MALPRTSIAATLTILSASVALAQPTAGPTPLPPAPVPTEGSGSGSNQGPTVSPEKVEQAKETAKTAALTPIVPNPRDLTRPAFQLYAEIDVPVVAIGTVFTLARLVKTQPAFCGSTAVGSTPCNKADLNAVDKITAGYWSPAWATSSDIGLYGLAAATGAILIADEGLLPALNDGVVVVEAAMSANAVASIMTLAAGRPRPFLYGDKAPDSVRNSADAGLSFLSSHTSMSFAIVTSLYIAEHRLHPHSTGPKVMLGVGLAVASFVGVGRVMSGYHFITDVVGGAVVGSSLGVMISSIHPSPVSIVPLVSEQSKGIGIQAIF
ncbi:MAG: Membrane-associated phospholipid phosphatase [Myxococcales bacterium]|nr:Membrane-associated phospholipid phosphatase [Myxococcales bacterium]